MRIRRLDVDRLVGVREIADAANVLPSAVTNWVDRYEDFPKPLVALTCGPVFYWPEIESWLRQTGRM